MTIRCGHCKSDFRDMPRAVKHVHTHEPKVRPPSKGKPIFRVRWEPRTGLIAEVLEAPSWGYE